jgi:uncharacterized membrane-anchored protein
MRRAIVVSMFAAMTSAPFAAAGMSSMAWTKGPTSVDLGGDVARIELDSGHAFAGADETRRLLREMGNTVDNSELGMVTPTAEDQDWMVLFEYDKAGYVKDDDKDAIDKDAILESYQKGTEEANKARKARGIPALHVTGWFEEPHYDAQTHNLVWALRAKEDGGGEVVNYNVRLLGREGYMSVTLVDEPAKLAASKPHVEKLLSTFAYKKGKSYAEWVSGDKVAEYGLVALVAGGAGAAAVKMGLFATLLKVLAKGGKAVVILLIGLAAGLKKMFTRAEPA